MCLDNAVHADSDFLVTVKFCETRLIPKITAIRISAPAPPIAAPPTGLAGVRFVPLRRDLSEERPGTGQSAIALHEHQEFPAIL